MFDYEGPLGLPRLTEIGPFARMTYTPDEWEPCDKHSRDEMDKNICTAIKEVSLELLVENEDLDPHDPEEINSGYCYYVADKAYYLLGKPDEVDVIERFSPMGSNHGYIKYRGRYFDAEVPHGTDEITGMPVIERFAIDPEGDFYIRSDGETAMGLTEWVE